MTRKLSLGGVGTWTPILLLLLASARVFSENTPPPSCLEILASHCGRRALLAPCPPPSKRDTVRSLQELFGSVLYMHFPLPRPDALLHLCAHTCVQERGVSPRSASLTVKDFINNCLGKISLRRMATDAAPSSIPTESLPLI